LTDTKDPRFPTLKRLFPFAKPSTPLSSLPACTLPREKFAPKFELEDKPNPVSARRNPEPKMKIVPVACLEDNYAYLYESQVLVLLC
jgi:hypothetical protein